MVADTVRPGRLTAVIATLLVAATVFFLWGALAERSGESAESAEEIARETGDEPDSHSSESAEEGEHDESAEERAAEGGRHEGETAEGHSEEEEFRPLGLNLESTPLLVVGAMLSLVLAGLVLKRPRREVLLAVLFLTGGFTVLEIVEVAHQAEVENTGILTLALIAGVLHAAAALVAGLALKQSQRPAAATPAG